MTPSGVRSSLLESAPGCHNWLGYRDLARSAVTFEAFGIKLRAASLKDILRSKLASDRPQDQQDAVVIIEMLKRV